MLVNIEKAETLKAARPPDFSSYVRIYRSHVQLGEGPGAGGGLSVRSQGAWVPVLALHLSSSVISEKYHHGSSLVSVSSCIK